MNRVIDDRKGTGQGPRTEYARGRLDTVPGFETDGSEMKVLDVNLPSGALTLGGSLSIPIKPVVKGSGKIEAKMLIEWSFTPSPPPKIELEMKAEAVGAPGWEMWRPYGGPDETTPGAHVLITASVISKVQPLADKVKWIAVRLTETSSEKGISVNYPEKAVDPPEPDLRFRIGDDNPLMNVQADRVSVWRPKSESLTANLSCFDYGAWGTAIAEAELESGRRVLGHVKGKPSERTLRIPDRPVNSLIAAAWNPPGKDDADVDDKPEGDKQPGDGLTNYEEYRGFHVNGVWTDGDPKTKDFFVRNEAGAPAEAGITLFKDISRLHVHRLEVGEISKDRVVNFNRTEGPHKVDQHGIRIKDDPSLGQYCRAIRVSGDGPGQPKDFAYVGLGAVPTNIVDLVADGTVTKGLYAAAAVAHELLHCCNVYHHGEEPVATYAGVVWTKEPDGIYENGVKIRVLDSKNNDITNIVTFTNVKGKQVKIVDWYAWRGTAGGDVGCVMRYDAAHAYTPQGAPNERVFLLTGEEPIGGGLCTSGKATGTNDNPARFGPCAANRGNCAGQILVNDKAKAPTR